MTTWVVSPCHRGRLGELKEMLASLAHDPRHVMIVTTMPDPIDGDDLLGQADHVVVFEKPGMLFGEWINTGLRFIADEERNEPYEVLCIGSSLRGTPDTIPMLANALRTQNLTMVGPDLFGRIESGYVKQHQHDERTLWNRVPGICFMIRGELGLRFDPQFRWWYGEDDLEMQARAVGPVGLVGGAGVTLTAPNGHPLNAQQEMWAAEDRGKFVLKWGREPW